MTTWPDEVDDFMDPTAPPASCGEEATTVDNWQAQDVPEGSAEHDFLQIFHFWLTPEGRLAKIRITNRWRERVQGKPLSLLLTAGFKQRQKQATGTPVAVQAERVDTSEPVDQAFLSRWLESLFVVDEKERKLEEKDGGARPGRWVSPPNTGTSANGRVTVHLGKGARTTEIKIDEDWAKSTRVSEICDAVQQAHDAAYAEFVEPEFAPGEYGELANELATLEEEMRVRMGNIGR